MITHQSKVMISGASDGLGKALALAIANKYSCSLALCGRSEEKLKNTLEAIHAIVINKYDNYEEALNNCDSHVVSDIVFIAVDGEDSEGLKLARYIRTYDSHCKIIITSPVKDYAYDAFTINAFNYVLQPYDEKRISALVDELCHIFQKIDARYITLNSKFGYYRIKHKDIVYVESLKRQVFFHCKDGSVISINDKLDNIEKLLDDRRFLRCHKSYLVSMNYINKLENRHFTLISNISIPIPKESLNVIKKQYTDYIEN